MQTLDASQVAWYMKWPYSASLQRAIDLGDLAVTLDASVVVPCSFVRPVIKYTVDSPRMQDSWVGVGPQ